MICIATKHRDSSVGIDTGYGLEGRTSIAGRIRIFLFSIASRLAHPDSYWTGTGDYFRKGKKAGAWSSPLTTM
jgi:hypothetical protein